LRNSLSFGFGGYPTRPQFGEWVVVKVLGISGDVVHEAVSFVVSAEEPNQDRYSALTRDRHRRFQAYRCSCIGLYLF
jgi:hypothetical protein